MSTIEHYQPASQWDILQAQSKALAKSGFVPTAYRGKPDDILAAGLYGDTVGLALTAALSYINVISGRPTLSAEGMLALVRARGHSVSGTSTDKSATVTGKRSDTGDTFTVDWNMDMARRAGLAGKDTWKQYPEAMLWARAVSQLCRMLFSDVLLGLSYTPEEAADIEAAEARFINRATGEISPAPVPGPAKVKKTVTQAGPGGQHQVIPAEGADPDPRLVALRTRANALTGDGRKLYRAYLAEVQIDPTIKFEDMTPDQVEVAEALLDRLAQETEAF